MKNDQSSSGQEVTLQVVMSHMQHGFRSVNKRFDAMELKLDTLEKKMDVGFADLNDRIRWMESHDLPKRVSRLEDKVFAGVDT